MQSGRGAHVEVVAAHAHPERAAAGVLRGEVRRGSLLLAPGMRKRVQSTDTEPSHRDSNHRPQVRREHRCTLRALPITPCARTS